MEPEPEPSPELEISGRLDRLPGPLHQILERLLPWGDRRALAIVVSESAPLVVQLTPIPTPESSLVKNVGTPPDSDTPNRPVPELSLAVSGGFHTGTRTLEIGPDMGLKDLAIWGGPLVARRLLCLALNTTPTELDHILHSLVSQGVSVYTEEEIEEVNARYRHAKENQPLRAPPICTVGPDWDRLVRKPLFDPPALGLGEPERDPWWGVRRWLPLSWRAALGLGPCQTPGLCPLPPPHQEVDVAVAALTVCMDCHLRRVERTESALTKQRKAEMLLDGTELANMLSSCANEIATVPRPHPSCQIAKPSTCGLKKFVKSPTFPSEPRGLLNNPDLRPPATAGNAADRANTAAERAGIINKWFKLIDSHASARAYTQATLPSYQSAINHESQADMTEVVYALYSVASPINLWRLLAPLNHEERIRFIIALVNHTCGYEAFIRPALGDC